MPMATRTSAAMPAEIEKTGAKALVRSIGILGTCMREAPEFGESRGTPTRGAGEASVSMTDFSVRSDAVDVEQIMRQIRSRIREKRGVDYTEEEIRELASVKLQTILDPKGVRSDLLEQYRRLREESGTKRNYAFEDTTLFDSPRPFVRAIRKLLRPILKLFFNPDPLIEALHIQSATRRGGGSVLRAHS